MKGYGMQQPKQFDVQHAIVTMLAVKFLEVQGGEYTITQEELKGLLETKTVLLELVDPTQPQTTNIKCMVMTLDAAKAMLNHGKKVIDHTKK